MTFPARLERFRAVDSTQRVVREWLDDGQAEVAVAVADHQTAGRGRQGRTWLAPLGAGLLLSVGFRPADLAAHQGWRLAAVVALAMRDAAEEVAGLRDGTLRLKWPNDIVADGPRSALLKVGGVLGETVSTGDRVESAVVGIGINTAWKAADFPWSLAAMMTSLRELSAGRLIDNSAVLDAFLARLEPRHEALKAGAFDAAGWSLAQLSTGRRVVVDVGGQSISGIATGVDPDSGALLVQSDDDTAVAIGTGEVIRCRVG